MNVVRLPPEEAQREIRAVIEEFKALEPGVSEYDPLVVIAAAAVWTMREIVKLRRVIVDSETEKTK